MATERAPVIAGTKVGRYTLLGKLAAGGMAEVFLARQDGPQGFTKTVIIKRILRDLGRDPEFVRMFLDEARLAALINHPNVVSIYELGEDAEAGVFFMAMEFIDGCNLKRITHDGLSRGKPVAPALCARILADACAGLDFAHNLRGEDGQPLQIVHRDVSPENILVSYSGQVKVVDFGIAKATLIEGRTQTGQLKGKYGYMPPEQLLGTPLDRRGDVWALGIVLYWMLTGVKPFRGDSEGEIIQRIVSTEPPPLLERAPNTPQGLVDIVARALTKDRERRYPTARAMQQDLEGWLARQGELVNTAALGDYMAAHFPEQSDQERLLVRSLLTGTAQRNTPSSTDVSLPAPPSKAPLATAPRREAPQLAETTTDARLAAGLGDASIKGRLKLGVGVVTLVALGAGAAIALSNHPQQAPAASPVVTGTLPEPAAIPKPKPSSDLPVPPIVATPTSVAPTPSTPTPPATAPTPAAAKHHRTAGAAQAPGQITILVSPWANVFLDGQPAGMTPMQPLEATPGTHRVRLVNEPLHADKQLTVVVRSGQTSQVRAKLDQGD